MKIKQTILFGVLALLGGFIGGILSDGLPRVADAKSDVEKVVKAEKFELIDVFGNVKAELNTEGASTFFRIGSENHLSKFLVSQDPASGVSLSLISEKSQGIILSTLGNKTRIDLLSGKETDDIIYTRFAVTLDSDGIPSLELHDNKKNLRLVLGKIELKDTKTGSTEIRSTGSIVIFDEKGNVIYKVP